MSDDDRRPEAGRHELERDRWTTGDGRTFHKMMRDEAEIRYQFAESGVDVETELEVVFFDSNNKPIGYGFADLVIDNKHVIDYKTDQMNDWTVSTARTHGARYAQQVSKYANSPLMSRDAEGHLVMVGNRSEDHRVESAFREAAEEHGVSVIFCEHGEPTYVMDQIEERFISLDRSYDLRRPPEIELTEMVKPTQPTDDTSRFVRSTELDKVDALLHVKSETAHAVGDTFSEIQTNWPRLETETNTPYASQASASVLFPLVLHAFGDRIKNSQIPIRLAMR